MFDQKVYYVESLLEKHSNVINEKLLIKFNGKYKIAYTRRIVKNFVEDNYRMAFSNLQEGTKKFGLLFFFKVVRFYFSYAFRFNKLLRAIKK